MRILWFLLIPLFIYASYLREGIIYYKQQNYTEALKAFENAVSEDDSVNAYYFLGLLTLRGLGTKVNLKKAEKYLKISYNSGNARAACLLGELYILKYKNPKKATKFLKEGLSEGARECQQIAKQYKIKL